jgi:hypothetical protein
VLGALAIIIAVLIVINSRGDTGQSNPSNPTMTQTETPSSTAPSSSGASTQPSGGTAHHHRPELRPGKPPGRDRIASLRQSHPAATKRTGTPQ